MRLKPFLNLSEIRDNRAAWTPISRETALRHYRNFPVAVVHALNGLEAAAWFDDSSQVLMAMGPYRYDSLRYFLFNSNSSVSGNRTSGGGSRQTGGKPVERELKVFDFPLDEIAEQELESRASRTALNGALKAGSPLNGAPNAGSLLDGALNAGSVLGGALNAGSGLDGALNAGPLKPGPLENSLVTDLRVSPEIPEAPGQPGIPDVPAEETVVEAGSELSEKRKPSFYSLRLVDENGKPVDGIELTLRADGKDLNGRSANGVFRIEGVDEGVAEVGAKSLLEARKAVLDSLLSGPREGGAEGPGGGGRNRLVLRSGAEPVLAQTGKDTEVVLVVPPREVTVIEVVDGMFRLDSAVVLPEAETPSADSHESLSSASLFATALEFSEANPERKLLVAGHTDTSGTEKHNQVLSEDRAATVLFCLAGGEDNRIAFGDICDARHLIADYKQILSWAAARFGFPCDPGKIDNVEFTGIEPIKAFQRSYNSSREDLGVPDADELKVDGSMGPNTWRAVFDCYEAALADEVSDGASIAERLAALAELRGKLRFMDDGTRAMGFGENHPLDAVGRNGFRSQQNRRVELLYFHEGEEPDLERLPKESEIYAPGIFKRIPIDEASPGTLTFLVTDDRGLPVPGATVEAVGPGGIRTATADALGAGALAALPRGIYVVKSRKRDLWLDRVVVKVAPGSEARPLPSRALGDAI